MVGPVRVSQGFGASDILKKMKKNFFWHKSRLMTIPALRIEMMKMSINELIFTVVITLTMLMVTNAIVSCLRWPTVNVLLISIFLKVLLS